MSEPIITIQKLTKVFGEGETQVHALENIDLTIQKGEIFGIIGLSGAGKSTLVRCMNLLERPTSGSILVNGKEMTTLSQKEREVAKLAAFGMRNGEIAKNLNMSLSAVKQAVSNISNKTGVSRDEFAAIL